MQQRAIIDQQTEEEQVSDQQKGGYFISILVHNIFAMDVDQLCRRESRMARPMRMQRTGIDAAKSHH